MVTVGEVLKNKREKLKLGLDTASSETKIQKRFLQYIEKNEFFPFESEVFLTGFIKIYAKYLNLDVDKVLALYRRTNPKVDEPKTNIPPFFDRKSRKGSISISPKNIVIALLVLFSLLIVTYIGFQIYKFQKPPLLSIISPLNETTVQEQIVKISGKTEKNVSVEINNVITEVDENGNFEKDVTLVEGNNLITIKAKKNSNSILESLETLKIVYQKAIEVETEKVYNNKIKLEVLGSPAWIKLDIDDENKIAKVVQPSIQEFDITAKMNIVSGRINNTKIYFNDQLVPWPVSEGKGVADLKCTILGDAINCE